MNEWMGEQLGKKWADEWIDGWVGGRERLRRSRFAVQVTAAATGTPVITSAVALW